MYETFSPSESLIHQRWLEDLHRRLVAGEVAEVEKRLRVYLSNAAWLQGKIYPEPKEPS